MLGIGVGIDYALLIVTRYRAASRPGATPREAVGRGRSRPPGRSVLIAGTTVVISLLGLFLMGLPYLYGAALATIIAVVVVMAASVTLVPALLAMAGPRIDRLRIPGRRTRRRRRRLRPRRALGPRRPAPALGRRDRGRRGAAGARVSVRRPAARLPGPRQRRAPTRPRARPTTSSRRASARARTGRCCWRRRPPATATATAMAALAGRLRAQPGVAAVERARDEPARATPSCSP